MNRSSELMYPIGRSIAYNTTTSPAAAAVPTAVSGQSTTTSLNHYFDQCVPVSCRYGDREELQKPLGLLITTCLSGASGLSRAVRMRLTDPSDPFFLYHLELLEDDYGHFKKALELQVDFSEFPKFLAELMGDVASGVENRLVTFTVEGGASSGILRLLETNRFRHVEHMTLTLLRDGDVGQKKYLAERFLYFQEAFLKSDLERREDTQRLQDILSAVQRELGKATAERDELRERLKIEATVAENSRSGVVAKLREEHSAECRRLQQQAEEERHAMQQRLDELARQANADIKQRDSDLSTLRARVNALESTEVSLNAQIRIKDTTLDGQRQELAHLAQQVQELHAFRQHATRTMSEGELQGVTLTERLRAAQDNLRSRDDEIRMLRAQSEKDGNYVHVLSDQLRQAEEKLKNAEESLKKSHHIIANQLQAAKSAKEKSGQAQEHQRALRSALEEQKDRSDQLERNLHKIELEKQQRDGTIDALKQQHEKLIQANEELEKQLQLSQNALVHLQRHSATSGGRHFSSLSGAPGYSPASDVYSQFSKHATAPSAGGAAGTSSFLSTSSYAPGGVGVSGGGLYGASSHLAATAASHRPTTMGFTGGTSVGVPSAAVPPPLSTSLPPSATTSAVASKTTTRDEASAYF